MLPKLTGKIEFFEHRAFPAVSAYALGRFRRHLLPSGEYEALNANGS